MFSCYAETIDELFVTAIEALVAKGKPSAPRGLQTVELFPASFELRNPRARMLLADGRRINPAFAIAEALWIISGSDDSWIFNYNKGLRKYADNGILRGAYGPRLRRWAGDIDQLDYIRRLLMSDPATRRAVIQIYDPGSVSATDSDIPCTIGHRFMIRNGQLHLFTTMRSQDIWLGFPYDVFSNTLLQEIVAGWVGVPIGHYYHLVDSLHLYGRDVAAARSVSLRNDCHPSAMKPVCISWDDLTAEVGSLLDGTTSNTVLAPLALMLRSYRYWTSGNRREALSLASGIEGVLGAAAQLWYQRLTPVADRPHET